MFWRWAVLGIAAVCLSACASQRTGFDYAGVMQKVGPPRSGQTRIVVLEEKASGLSATVCDVKVDGGPMGQLKPGTYVYADRPAGRHQLWASENLFPGESKHDVTTESGRTYFFLARTSDRHNAVMGMTMAGGLAGMLVGSAVTTGSDSPGPIDFVRLDEAAARTTIAELQLAE